MTMHDRGSGGSAAERPRFHLTPPEGWMNDPNGLVVRDGTFHAFYQHDPDGPRWARMHWGHATSTDMVTWTHQPIAISPDQAGVDDFGCWSGCIVDDSGHATMFYTGVTTASGVRQASICRAMNDGDLGAWSKDPAGPCIAAPPEGIAPDAFRDPFVYRDDQGWVMLVGAGSTDGMGVVLIYRSPDLHAWTLVGDFLSAIDVERADGADGPVWECPQLLRFGATAVLVVSVVDRTPGVRPSHVTAFVGQIVDDRFLVGHAEELGMGPDFYAPAIMVMPDGRRLLFGWVPEDPPHPSSARTWAGCLTFPRTVSITDDGRLDIALATEVSSLRHAQRRYACIALAERRPAWLHEPFGHHFEIAATIEALGAAEVIIELLGAASADPDVRVTFRPDSRVLSVARRGIVSVAGRSSQSARILPVSQDGLFRIRLLVDGSVVEMEVDGRITATFRRPLIGPGGPAVAFSVVGGTARILELLSWTLAAPATSDVL
jgi:beta-fructofuranosidase